MERSNITDAVPREFLAGGAADGFVAFEEAGHEELLGHGGELDPSVIAVGHEFGGRVGINDAQHGAGLGGVVGEGKFAGRTFFADGETHQGIAVGGSEIDFPFEHFLFDEADVLRGHGGAAGEDSLDAGINERHAFGEGFEKFRSGEQAADVAVADDGGGLVDDVFLIELGHAHFAHADEAFHPAGVEVDEVTGTAADVGEVLDGEAQAARAGGADHQPVGALREKVGAVMFGEFRVVGHVIVPADALFRHAGGAAGFEDVVGPFAEGFRDETGGIFLAQNLVIEGLESLDVGEAGDVLERIEAEVRHLFEPVRASGFRGEMPFHHFAGVGVEGFGGSLRG